MDTIHIVAYTILCTATQLHVALLSFFLLDQRVILIAAAMCCVALLTAELRTDFGHNMLLHCTIMLYYTVLYYDVLHCTLLYCSVLCLFCRCCDHILIICPYYHYFLVSDQLYMLAMVTSNTRPDGTRGMQIKSSTPLWSTFKVNSILLSNL